MTPDLLPIRVAAAGLEREIALAEVEPGGPLWEAWCAVVDEAAMMRAAVTDLERRAADLRVAGRAAG